MWSSVQLLLMMARWGVTIVMQLIFATSKLCTHESQSFHEWRMYFDITENFKVSSKETVQPVTSGGSRRGGVGALPPLKLAKILQNQPLFYQYCPLCPPNLPPWIRPWWPKIKCWLTTGAFTWHNTHFDWQPVHNTGTCNIPCTYFDWQLIHTTSIYSILCTCFDWQHVHNMNTCNIPCPCFDWQLVHTTNIYNIPCTWFNWQVVPYTTWVSIIFHVHSLIDSLYTKWAFTAFHVHWELVHNMSVCNISCTSIHWPTAFTQHSTWALTTFHALIDILYTTWALATLCVHTLMDSLCTSVSVPALWPDLFKILVLYLQIWTLSNFSVIIHALLVIMKLKGLPK